MALENYNRMNSFGAYTERNCLSVLKVVI